MLQNITTIIIFLKAIDNHSISAIINHNRSLVLRKVGFHIFNELSKIYSFLEDFFGSISI